MALIIWVACGEDVESGVLEMCSGGFFQKGGEILGIWGILGGHV